MFTGLIEAVGTVAAVRHGAGQSRLVIHAQWVGPGGAVGDSVCVNGVCLTVVAGADGRLEFQAIAETSSGRWVRAAASAVTSFRATSMRWGRWRRLSRKRIAIASRWRRRRR